MTSTNGSRTRELIEIAARDHGWEVASYDQSVYLTRGDRAVNVNFTRAGGVNWAASGTPVTGGRVAAGPDNPVFRGTGKREQVLEYLRTHGSTDDERPAAVVTNVSDLTVPMRAGLTDRYRVPAETARALRRRGLVVARGEAAHGGYQVELTEAGKRARDAVLAPLTERARVRNIRTGLVGRVVRLSRTERCDVVVLRWDTWRTDTAGSPAYLEVVSDDVETGTDEVAFAECESNDNQRRRAAGVYVPLTDYNEPHVDTVVDVLPDGSTVVRPIEDEPPRFVRGAATPGYEVDAVMPASVTYCGTQPTPQSHPHAYGFLRSAVLGQAAGRPFADPVAAVRHLDECLRLAGYSVPTMEG